MVGKALQWATIAAIVVLGQLQLAKAHSWYPPECCHEIDCAPVDEAVWLSPAESGPPQLRVTSKFGTTTVPRDFSVRQSKDSRMHICMGYDDFGRPSVLCFFIPPSM